MATKNSRPIRNRLVMICGKPGSGKTLMAAYLISHYRRSYANFSVYDRSGKRINGLIRSIYGIDAIRYSDIDGVIALDEIGQNGSSRRSMSKENAELSKLPMLGRKKRLDIITMQQLDYSADKYFRDLCDHIYMMRSFFYDGRLIFECEVYQGGREPSPQSHINTWQFDLLEWSQITGISYNTLERALFSEYDNA